MIVNRKGGYLPKTKAKAYWKLVIFHKGQRIEKPIADKAKLIEAYKRLRDTPGVKVAVVSRVRAFWPSSDDEGPDNPDKLWCGYCRQWRFFALPSVKNGEYDPKDDNTLDILYRRALASSQTPWCQWCHISMADFHIRQMNDLWGWAPRRRRSKRRRPLTKR